MYDYSNIKIDELKQLKTLYSAKAQTARCWGTELQPLAEGAALEG